MECVIFPLLCDLTINIEYKNEHTRSTSAYTVFVTTGNTAVFHLQTTTRREIKCKTALRSSLPTVQLYFCAIPMLATKPLQRKFSRNKT
jgi:hypothetical protein